MSIQLLPNRFSRRALLGGGFASIMSALPVGAQDATLTSAKLESMIQAALADPETITFARPAILGLADGKLVAHQLTQTYNNSDYQFSVFIPRRDDGLVFSKGQSKPLFFAMHRTGLHLNRLISAINRDGKLVGWFGPEAEKDFAEQKAAWAKPT